MNMRIKFFFHPKSMKHLLISLNDLLYILTPPVKNAFNKTWGTNYNELTLVPGYNVGFQLMIVMNRDK